MSKIYYVYALKDPTLNPAMPFYIGKGTGSRDFHHLLKPDRSAKGRRIKMINDSGAKVLIQRLVSDLEEHDAFRIEAELIAAFGTQASGGILTNDIVPSGKSWPMKKTMIVPSGVIEKAQIGLKLLKSAVLELAEANHKSGISNAEATNYLGLQSDFNGRSVNYLAYSILALLMRDGRLLKEGLKYKIK